MKKLSWLFSCTLPYIAVAQVGIGTTQPKSMLHIVSDTPGALTIQDTTEGLNKVLISDANGSVMWVQPKTLSAGSLSNESIESGTSSGIKNLETSIVLSQGVWLINFGLVFINESSNNSSISPKIYLSSDSTSINNDDFEFLSNSIIPSTISYNKAQIITQGYIIVKVNSENLKLHLLMDNVWGQLLLTRYAMWKFLHDKKENYFYAIPLNS